MRWRVSLPNAAKLPRLLRRQIKDAPAFKSSSIVASIPAPQSFLGSVNHFFASPKPKVTTQCWPRLCDLQISRHVRRFCFFKLFFFFWLPGKYQRAQTLLPLTLGAPQSHSAKHPVITSTSLIHQRAGRKWLRACRDLWNADSTVSSQIDPLCN